MNYEVKNIYKKTNNKRVGVKVIGSKSITARALMLAALADGDSILYGASDCDDCTTFKNCLNSLGIECVTTGTTVKVSGCGGKLNKKSGKIDVGSSGTAARFLLAFLAFQDGEYYLTCSEGMKARPIQPLIKTLQKIGATFTFTEKEYSFPFYIRGTRSPARELSVDITASSQFLSALLMASVCARKPVSIFVSGGHGMSYVKMTIDMMWSFGVTVKEEGDKFIVSGKFSPKRYEIEPDISAACYFYAMNKILGTNIYVQGLLPHSMQGDSKFIELLKTFDGGKVDMSEFSDQALTLAAIAPYLSAPTEICGISHIRGQECDRINAIISSLAAMGVKCEERADGVIIYPSQPRPAKINTFGDHRVAMAFAVTGLRANGIIIENAQVCSKTFADYFEVLDDLCGRLRL